MMPSCIRECAYTINISGTRASRWGIWHRSLGDMLVVDGNPLEEIKVLGGQEKWFLYTKPPKPIKTIRVIMKDGVIFKSTPAQP